MLEVLSVKNYAIISSVRVEFTKGLNVLSGETGAGKSIIVGALSLLLGARGNSDMIRAGEKKLSVEGVFSFDELNPALKEALDENDIEYEDNTLIIRREINDTSKNTCRINDVTVSVSYLKRIGSLLVDIHGQHEHQRLLAKENHLYYLDMYAHESISVALAAVAQSYDFMNSCRKELDSLKVKQKEISDKKDEYASALAEIEKVSPVIGEDEKISARLKVLESAEKIYSLVDSAYGLLYLKNESVLTLLGDAINELEKVSKYDDGMESIIPMLSESLINIEESVNEIRAYRSNLEFEPYEIENLNERLSQLNRLKRKYGSIEDILERQEYMKDALSGFESIEDDIAQGEKKYSDAVESYRENAWALSILRRRAAENFSREIISQLKDMAMKDAEFEVRFTEKKPSPDGTDDVEFFITANKGQPLRELSKTASGGEVSRIMLSLKSIIGSRDGIECMIFDEIDTGISGNTAKVVGRKMASLAKSKQIIAITHLAQIASMADGHFLIEKKDIDDITTTSLRLLERDERIKELARIVGSGESETALSHGANLLSEAEEYKKGI
ncbi:MAG: DNA repair protein RecN [Anaerofustis stercorihominis]|nr:DNA repair protein RecN [Anaerofustis stercorihominis]